MATQSVTYVTSVCLDCKNILPSDVILCVPTAITADDSGFLAASLTAVCNQCVSNCGVYNQYTFSYDDTLLADPETPLKATEINNVFCLNCFTDWIQYLIDQALTD